MKRMTNPLLGISYQPRVLRVGLLEREDLSVWGAKGNYATAGRLFEERLRDASASATHVLRQCYAANSARNSIPIQMSRANPRGGGVGRTSAAGLEVEIVEATALLEFVQLARSGFQPNWKDDN